MRKPVIWLHEDALRLSHPVFKAAPPSARIIHIWDDAYLQAAGYSLKRLVFIYETVCALPLEILRGNSLEVVYRVGAETLYVPASNNLAIQQVIHEASQHMPVIVAADEPFVQIAKANDFRRFFQYWGKAQQTAFLPNGGADAQGN